jgi:UDP-glucose 4-epimerase
MSVLVLGGAGYIGSQAVYDLIDAGYDVAVVDLLSTGRRCLVNPAARFYEGDIRDADFLNGVFEREGECDTVMHFSASSLVGESMTDPLKYYTNNVCGTKILADCMLKNNVKNLVFSSTAAIYGDPSSIPIKEDDTKIPTNPYGESKLAIENMLKWVSEAHNLRYVALRYFNACGAHKDALVGEMHDPETHLIPIILQVANGERDKIMIFGDDYDTPDGTCIRDYIHVEDLASAHILAMEYLKGGGASEGVNLGNGFGFSVKEVIEAAREVTGHPIPAVLSPRREGDPARLIADCGKAKNLLGWSPRYTDIKSIIATAWKWHSKGRA